VKFRRWLPYGGVDNKWITGTNVGTFATPTSRPKASRPAADTLTATDITATLSQYACLYAVTDQVVDLYEDDIPAEMKKQTGQRIGLVREMVRYGVLKGMTNAFYAGGTNRGTVAASLTLNLIRKVTRALKANHAEMVHDHPGRLARSSAPAVEAAYLVFCHTDMEAAIRDLDGFTTWPTTACQTHPPAWKSARGELPLHPVARAGPYINSGAAVGTTGLFSTGGANIDVYPVIVCGEDAWGQVALRGKKRWM
jgi:N4-gp56 family major capsid protein